MAFITARVEVGVCISSDRSSGFDLIGMRDRHEDKAGAVLLDELEILGIDIGALAFELHEYLIDYGAPFEVIDSYLGVRDLRLDLQSPTEEAKG